MRKEEKGIAIILVLILLAVGSAIIAPSLSLAFTIITSKQKHTEILKEHYARDGAAEYAQWELLYGLATSQLTNQGQETTYSVTLNGVDTDVRIRMQAKLGEAGTGGAEDNKIRVTMAVVCAKDGDGVYDDDCLTLPENVTGMFAKYTITLEQVSPDTSVPLLVVYDELPSKFDWNPALNPLVSQDGSFSEIVSATATNIGSSQNQIWKWDFTSSPISFTQGQKRQFTMIVEVEKAKGEYCNRGFIKMQSAPHESSGPLAKVRVGADQEGCPNGGMVVNKYVDQILALPNQTTIFTYIIDAENIEKNSQQIDLLKDVLSNGGFLYCNGTAQGDPSKTCDPPMFKLGPTPFDPGVDSFTDTTGYTTMVDPTQTYDATDDRWELVWNAGWGIEQAGKPKDTFTMRFQAEITPTVSGSYYNEVFIDVDCSVPSALTSSPDDVTSQADYCSSYSWPSGGTLVPTYDVRAEANITMGWGNVTVDPSGTGALESWHVEGK